MTAIRMELTIPDGAWEFSEDHSHGLITLDINGTLHHLEAISVQGNEWTRHAEDDKEQYELHRHEHCDALEDWGHAAGGDGPFSEIDIEGKPYVVFLSPYCD